LIVHFIEFVDKTSSFVGQYKCTSLESPFGCNWVLVHACSKTDCGGALSGSEDCSMGGLLDILQDLRFRGTGITKEEDINVPADGMFPIDILGDTAKQRERYSCLDIFVAIDTWGNGVDDLPLVGAANGIYSLSDVRVFTEGFDFAFVVFA